MPRIPQIGDKIAVLTGFSRYALAALLGALATLALPPFFYIPLLLIAFPGLLLLLSGCTRGRQAFFTGWWFGFAHHVAGLYWICNALLVDADRFAWMIPFTIALIPAYVAIYSGLACWLTWQARAHGFQRILMFAAFWTLMEMLRGVAFTGFPWNLIGYVWGDMPLVMRIASLTGVYGLTLLTVLAASLPMLCCAAARGKQAVLLPCAAVFALWAILIPAASFLQGGVDKPQMLKVRIVQPNIAQKMKWDQFQSLQVLQDHLELTHAAYKGKPPQVVIWPEAAVPFRLDALSEGMRLLIKGALPLGAILIAGAVRVEDAAQEGRIPHNSVLALDAEGNVIASYDKHHLVPFGEYVPLHRFLPFVDKITQGGMDFVPGQGAATLNFKGTKLPPASPLICYEAIFPGEVKDRKTLPAWMVNVTNDGWYGDSSGPYQHFTMARMRAVEEGMPLVRAANTGISGVFAPDGTVLGKLELGRKGVLDVDVPYTMPPAPRTFYARFGNLIPLLMAMVCIVVSIPVRRKHNL